MLAVMLLLLIIAKCLIDRQLDLPELSDSLIYGTEKLIRVVPRHSLCEQEFVEDSVFAPHLLKKPEK